MIALIYGGSGSGKSAVAEAMVARWQKRASGLVYIATMPPTGPEAEDRIARHRAARLGLEMTTLELSTNLASAVIPAGSVVLLECLGNLTANEMFSPEGAGKGTRDAVLRGMDSLARQAFRIVVVSNDVFGDGVVYPPETEGYRQNLAELNQIIARRSALVAEVVCGIPLWHKRDEAWN